MTHQIAKLMLEHAGTAIEREKAIQSAIQLGMPLKEIEDYLDWLETLRGHHGQPYPVGKDRTLDSPPGSTPGD